MVTHASQNKTPASGASDFLVQKKGLRNGSDQEKSSTAFSRESLKIGSPDDIYEKEADAMADKVMSPTTFEAINFSSSPVIANRKCAACEKEENLQRKESGNDSNSVAPPVVHEVLNSSDARSLDPDTKNYMQSRFNYDFGNVKIHDNDKAAASADAVNAFAYTVGSDIVFNSGQYNTNSDSGKRLLAHELTHVVQQTDSAKRKVMRAARKTGPNEVEVDGPNGVCHATRVFEPKKTSPGIPTPPTVDANIDETNITFSIKWCRGSNRGNITLGADVPAQAKEVLQKIVEGLNSGSDLKQIENDLSRTTLQPFLDVLIASKGKFSISAHGELNVGSGGVEGGKGALDFSYKSIDVILTGGKSPQPGGNGQPSFDLGISISFTPGKNQTFDCPVIPINIPQKSHWVCKCPTPKTTGAIPGGFKVNRKQVKFLYFNYQSTKINRSLSPEKEGDVDSISNLEKALRDGYRVTKITGYTSPEGDLEQRPGFEGNKLLSEERAIAAKGELKSICQRINLSMRNPGQCDHTPIMEMKPLEGDELYGSDEKGKEIKREDLPASVPGDFLKNEREAAHRDPKLVEKLKGLTPKKQVEIIYPLLRRAEIEFEKQTVTQETKVDIPEGEADCPDDIVEQAKKAFKDSK